MNVRRVVTGHSGNKSIIVSDGPSPKVFTSRAVPGSSSALIWATASRPSVPHEGGDAISSESKQVPEVGETRLVVATFPPDSVMMDPSFDPVAAGKELMDHDPEFARHLEADNPGMHTTDTVDYAFVLDGEIWLEVDDGAQIHLKAGDVVVQNGTRHAWRNKGDKPAKMGFVLIGASRN